uniref:Uncharacterized protein n=1 Tax=Anopheles farauti TaxID=69004 RepID=A0A182QYJ8_9DIPT
MERPTRWALLLFALCATTAQSAILTPKLPEDISNSIDIDNSPLTRVKRNGNIRGSFRGQTQSQYLHFGNSQDGKAEAEATQHSSRAVVVGTNGMGQAQSQSMGGDCSTCYGAVDGGGSYVYGMDEKRVVLEETDMDALEVMMRRVDPLVAKVRVVLVTMPMADRLEVSMHTGDRLVVPVEVSMVLEATNDQALILTVDQRVVDRELMLTVDPLVARELEVLVWMLREDP